MITAAYLDIAAGLDTATIFAEQLKDRIDCRIVGAKRLVDLFNDSSSRPGKPSPRRPATDGSKNIPVEGACSALHALQVIAATLPRWVAGARLTIGYTLGWGPYHSVTIITGADNWLTIEPELRPRRWPRRRATIQRKLLATSLVAEVQFVGKRQEANVRLHQDIPLPIVAEPLAVLASAYL